MPIDPFLGGAMIAGGASLAAGGASIAANANLNKKNRNWQEKMVREQREYEQHVYDQRYSPSAQAYNLRAAGINPIGNTQTMNVGTSSSTPTPATTPADFSFIGEAGQAIASSLHARQAMKLEQAKFNQQVTEENRRFLLDLKTSELNAEETRAIINSKIEELESLKLDNETKRLNKQMLEDFINAGGNTYSDASALTQAQTAYQTALKDYQDLMGQIAKETNEEQKKVLRAQAESLKASAQKSYADAILSNAQTEVAKSTKLKIDSETQIGKDNAAQAAALHELKIIEQTLTNQGLYHDNIRKQIDNTRERIRNGGIKNFGELGAHIWYNLDDILTFM